MTLDFFIDAIARAMEEGTRQAYPPDKEDEYYANLPSDWAARLDGQGNGIQAKMQTDGVLQVVDPTGRWKLYLVVPPLQPDPAPPKQ